MYLRISSAVFNKMVDKVEVICKAMKFICKLKQQRKDSLYGDTPSYIVIE